MNLYDSGVFFQESNSKLLINGPQWTTFPIFLSWNAARLCLEPCNVSSQVPPLRCLMSNLHLHPIAVPFLNVHFTTHPGEWWKNPGNFDKGRRSWALEKATPFSIWLKCMDQLLQSDLFDSPIGGHLSPEKVTYWFKRGHFEEPGILDLFWISDVNVNSLYLIQGCQCMISNHRPEWCQFPRGPKQLPCDLNKSLKMEKASTYWLDVVYIIIDRFCLPKFCAINMLIFLPKYFLS